MAIDLQTAYIAAIQPWPLTASRASESVQIPLTGLTVLIGDNGTGKSTILEAFELLRQAAKAVDFIPDIVERRHGGLTNLLQRGAERLTLSVTIEGAGPGLMYSFSAALVGTSAQIVEENLELEQSDDAPRPLFWRRGGACKYVTPNGEIAEYGAIPPQDLGVTQLGVNAPAGVKRLLAALDRIEAHVPFETRPLWQQRALDIRKGPRWPDHAEAATRLSRFGTNLPNCFQEIRNTGNGAWNRVLEMARLGLGEDVRDFQIIAPRRGEHELRLVLGDFPDDPISLDNMSEGQLTYLAFIALTELNRNRSALVFDEPEQHLHPALIARVVGMFEECSQLAPVVIATHSDRLLDALSDPGKSVVLCELDEHRTTVLRQPNTEQLGKWLQDYRGIGSLRGEGYESYVFEKGNGGAKCSFRFFGKIKEVDRQRDLGPMNS